jgi:hypothetical protein
MLPLFDAVSNLEKWQPATECAADLLRMERMISPEVFPPTDRAGRSRFWLNGNPQVGLAPTKEHLPEATYKGIVIVAHSQGTTISADLLRLLYFQHENSERDSTLTPLFRGIYQFT